MEGSHSIKVDTEVYLKLNKLKLKSQSRKNRKKNNSINEVLREIILDLKDE